MKKFAHGLRHLLLLPVLLLLGTACGEDDYHYPDIVMAYLTAHSGADGRLETVLADDGALYEVLNSVSAPHETTDTTLRIVANYAREADENGGTGVRLYAAQTAVSPIPLPAGQFENGVKTDPASVLSIWMGLDYLNVVLEVKTGGESHAFHFVEEEVRWDAAASRREVDLLLYHDAGDDPPYYTRRAYLSVPLRQYAVDGAKSIAVRFCLLDYEGREECHVLEYVPTYD